MCRQQLAQHVARYHPFSVDDDRLATCETEGIHKPQPLGERRGKCDAKADVSYSSVAKGLRDGGELGVDAADRMLQPDRCGKADRHRTTEGLGEPQRAV